MFVEVLQQVTARAEAEAAKRLAGRVAAEKGKRPPSPPPPARSREELEAVEAAEAEAEGRGVGCWRLPRLEPGEVCAAVSHLAVSLLLLGRQLPRCLLGCGAAASAVMSLLGRLAGRVGVRHEQLFEAQPTGAAAGGPAPMAPTQPGLVGSPALREWVVAAMRECLLRPLRGAPGHVQQAFVTAVAAQPDSELDFK